jgi:hypothetical protein
VLKNKQNVLINLNNIASALFVWLNHDYVIFAYLTRVFLKTIFGTPLAQPFQILRFTFFTSKKKGVAFVTSKKHFVFDARQKGRPSTEKTFFPVGWVFCKIIWTPFWKQWETPIFDISFWLIRLSDFYPSEKPSLKKKEVFFVSGERHL